MRPVDDVRWTFFVRMTGPVTSDFAIRQSEVLRSWRSTTAAPTDKSTTAYSAFPTENSATAATVFGPAPPKLPLLYLRVFLSLLRLLRLLLPLLLLLLLLLCLLHVLLWLLWLMRVLQRSISPAPPSSPPLTSPVRNLIIATLHTIKAAVGGVPPFHHRV